MKLAASRPEYGRVYVNFNDPGSARRASGVPAFLAYSLTEWQWGERSGEPLTGNLH